MKNDCKSSKLSKADIIRSHYHLLQKYPKKQESAQSMIRNAFCNACEQTFRESELMEWRGFSGMDPGCPYCGSDDYDILF